MQPTTQAVSDITEKVNKEEELKKQLAEAFKHLTPEEMEKATEVLGVIKEKGDNKMDTKELMSILKNIIHSGKQVGSSVATFLNNTEKIVSGGAVAARSFIADVKNSYNDNRKRGE